MAKGWFSAIPAAALAVLLAGAGSCPAQTTWLNPNPGGYGSGYFCDGGGCGKHHGGWLCALCSGANGPRNLGVGPTYTTAYNYTVDLTKPGVYGPPPWPFIWDWTFYSYYPAYYPNVSNYAVQPSLAGPVVPPGFLPAPGVPLPGAAVPVPGKLMPPVNGKEPLPERLPPPTDRRK
jgi:hypothetical protein